MNIYALTPHGPRGWDEFIGFVVVAQSSGTARRLAGSTAKPFDPHVEEDHFMANVHGAERAFWNDPETTLCRKVGVYTGTCTTAHVVLTSYHSG